MENLYKRSILIKNFNCYTASLDCNLILKEHIKKDKKKEIQELSRKSRLLLEKGAAYQNDIGFLKTNSNSLFNILFSGLTYILYYIHIIYMIILLATNFLIPLKKNRYCRIYSPFPHFKNNGFEFQRILLPSGKENVSIRL